MFYLLTLQFNASMMEQTLAAVPLFIFMGVMMEQANLMERLFDSVQKLLANVRGSLYLAVMFVATIFAAATGIVGASVTILGIMAGKPMIRSGYDVQLSSGLIAAGGTLGILIPPSIMLVVMGPVLEVPVTTLFAAAIMPGLLLAVMFTGYAMIRCWINPALGPPLPEELRAKSTTRSLGRLLRRSRAAGRPWSCRRSAASSSALRRRPRARASVPSARSSWPSPTAG